MQRLRNNHIFVDTETTGFHNLFGYLDNDVLTWSGVVTCENFNVLDELHVELKPKKLDNWESHEKIHGICLMDAIRFPEPNIGILKIIDFINRYDPDIWVEHSNSWFDKKFTHGLFNKHGFGSDWENYCKKTVFISSMKEFKSLGYKESSLEFCSKIINFNLRKHHNSLDDAKSCLQVYKWVKSKKINEHKQGELF